MPVLRRRPPAVKAPAPTVKIVLDPEKMKLAAARRTTALPASAEIEQQRKEEIKARLLAALPGAVNPASESADTIERYKAKVRNPMTAIRAKCVECSGGSLKEVAECKELSCALIPFRMGKNPFRKKREGNADHLHSRSESVDDEADDSEDADE